MTKHYSHGGWRWFPGGVMAFVIAIMLAMDSFSPLEHFVYRLLFQLRGATAWDDRLVLVTIDDESIRQLGRFPWSRQRYVQLLDRLSSAEASVVAIDLIWSEPSPDDSSLAAAMAQQGKVVLAQAWDKTGAPLVPVPTLAEAAIATGHVMKQADADSLVRCVDLQLRGQPALSIAAVQVYSLVKAPVTLPPLDQPLWVNWVGPISRAHSYSFADVIQGKVPAQAFHSKIVLVGVTATGLDSMVTPFDSYPPTGSVILHATMIQNLLQQNALRPLWGDWLWTPLLTGAFGL
ncbi:MAG: CHASE2 domain-containing protein, partial [Cyanobacteria bacterium]|nr:CHASE2 domain-containing protein [Cyanobacteriota bacterium]MDW8201790.1 CHASE2 domain-containing protein [Cyanobacteriota bacterium SKYGB_h_bin112]